MKNVINIYTGVLIKQHLIYIIVFVSSVAMLFFLLPGKWQEYQELQEKVVIMQKEVNRLGQQKSILGEYSPQDLEQLFSAANISIPNSYNYFSLYKTLSDFEQKTGMKIDSLSIPISAFAKDGVVLTIAASGNNESISNFLKNYTTQTGHAVGITDISIKPPTQAIQFNITFYTHTPPGDIKKISRINPSIVAILKNIDITASTSSETLPSYPIKSNPF